MHQTEEMLNLVYDDSEIDMGNTEVTLEWEQGHGTVI